jgi:hypothetical protein
VPPVACFPWTAGRRQYSFVDGEKNHFLINSLCCIVKAIYSTNISYFQNKIKIKKNLAKLRERTVQTQVNVVRHIFPPQLLKRWNIKNSKNIYYLLNYK